jgi:cytochrome c556
MSRRRGASLVRLLALVALLALAACGGERPGPTPADRQGIFEELARRGGTVSEIVAGDPGCRDPDLAGNAVRFSLTVPDTSKAAHVYLFTFKNRPFFERAKPAVDACQGAFEARSARTGGPVERIDVSPYRAFGDGWSPGLRIFLEATMRAVAGDGGVPRGRDGKPLSPEAIPP